MTTFQATLLHILFVAAAAAAPLVHDPAIAAALAAVGLAGTVGTAVKNSRTNPDGTPASVAYQPEKAAAQGAGK